MVHGFGLLRRRALLGALASSAAVGLAIPTTAAANLTSLTRCQDIFASGHYRLDADVGPDAPPFAACVSMFASDVTFDLNGHSIRAGFPPGFSGILVNNGPPTPRSWGQG